MNVKFERLELLVGADSLNKIKDAKVLIFGLGGVGGYVCHALVRSGLKHLDIVDFDTVNESNFNRLIIALDKNIGMLKTDVMKEYLEEINSDLKINAYNLFLDKDTINQFDFSKYDYIIDCIDTITSKLLIIEKAKECNVNIISSMGTGFKMSSNSYLVSDIYKTSMCPLARVMRYELRKREIKHLTVVYSKEEPMKIELDKDSNEKIVASSIFSVSAAGTLIAEKVFKDIVGIS